MGYSSVKSCACPCARACTPIASPVRVQKTRRIPIRPFVSIYLCPDAIPLTRKFQMSPLPNACVIYPMNNFINKKKKEGEKYILTAVPAV